MAVAPTPPANRNTLSKYCSCLTSSHCCHLSIPGSENHQQVIVRPGPGSRSTLANRHRENEYQLDDNQTSDKDSPNLGLRQEKSISMTYKRLKSHKVIC